MYNIVYYKYRTTTSIRCKMSATIDTTKMFHTAPFDPRFPNQNQTRYCYQSFLDFHRCQKVKGKSYEPCQYFQRTFKSICPDEWTEKWNEQIENGIFPGKI